MLLVWEEELRVTPNKSKYNSKEESDIKLSGWKDTFCVELLHNNGKRFIHYNLGDPEEDL